MRRMIPTNVLHQTPEGDIEIGKNLYVDGKIKDLSKIVDEHGNPRFVEGNLTPTAFEGCTYDYAKWSLSGTHLMIVIAGTIASGTHFSGTQNFLEDFELPQYIRDKIFPIGQYGVFDSKSFNIYAESNNTIAHSRTLYIQKHGNNIGIYSNGSAYDFAANCYFRIQFDLLIDTD